MNHDIIKVKALLAKHAYQVVVSVTNGNITATFPARLDPPMSPRISLQYEYVPNGVKISAIDEEKTVVEEQFYACPVYATRLLVFSHIIHRCLAMNFTFAVAEFFVNDEVVDEETLFQACIHDGMVEEDIALEGRLKNIILHAIFNGFTPQHAHMAQLNNVVEGFTMIQQIYLDTNNEKENSMAG